MKNTIDNSKTKSGNPSVDPALKKGEEMKVVKKSDDTAKKLDTHLPRQHDDPLDNRTDPNSQLLAQDALKIIERK